MSNYIYMGDLTAIFDCVLCFVIGRGDHGEKRHCVPGKGIFL